MAIGYFPFQYSNSFWNLETSLFRFRNRIRNCKW